MAWWSLYLLGTVTVLTIAVRRLRRRQKPLDDELYSKKVAIDHVHSGVAWVRSDGRLGSVNPAFAATLGTKPQELAGHDWIETIFAAPERNRIREAYSQMLLMGKEQFEANVSRSDGTPAWVSVLLVAVHDYKMRLVGHHFLMEDRTRERMLEKQVAELTKALQGQDSGDTYRWAVSRLSSQKK
jgi:PAS domain S-box-containing protein